MIDSTNIDWTSYIALTIASLGLLISFFSYRKVNSIKRLDLRLLLRTTVGELKDTFNDMPKIFDSANDSRKANLSAAGMFRSGMKLKWDEKLNTSRERINELEQIFTDLEANFESKTNWIKRVVRIVRKDMPADFDSMNQKELEDKLVEIRAVLREVSAIQAKYLQSIEDDKNDVRDRRREINADFRAKF